MLDQQGIRRTVVDDSSADTTTAMIANESMVRCITRAVDDLVASRSKATLAAASDFSSKMKFLCLRINALQSQMIKR